MYFHVMFMHLLHLLLTVVSYQLRHFLNMKNTKYELASLKYRYLLYHNLVVQTVRYLSWEVEF